MPPKMLNPRYHLEVAFHAGWNSEIAFGMLKGQKLKARQTFPIRCHASNQTAPKHLRQTVKKNVYLHSMSHSVCLWDKWVWKFC